MTDTGVQKGLMQCMKVPKDLKFPAYTNFLCDKAPVTAVLLRDTIEDTPCSSVCVILGRGTPNVAVRWLTRQILLWELLDSNLDPVRIYPD